MASTSRVGRVGCCYYAAGALRERSSPPPPLHKIGEGQCRGVVAAAEGRSCCSSLLSCGPPRQARRWPAIRLTRMRCHHRYRDCMGTVVDRRGGVIVIAWGRRPPTVVDRRGGAASTAGSAPQDPQQPRRRTTPLTQQHAVAGAGAISIHDPHRRLRGRYPNCLKFPSGSCGVKSTCGARQQRSPSGLRHLRE